MPNSGSQPNAERATLSRVVLAGSDAPVELLRAAYVTHRFSPHAHEEFAIGVVESGAVRTRLPRGMAIIPAGCIVALNPGDVHTGEAFDDAGYRYRMFYLADALLHRLAGDAISNGSMSAGHLAFPRPVIDDSALARGLARAHRLLESGSDHVAAEGVFVETLGELIARYGSRGPAHLRERFRTPVVRAVREYLEDEHARVVTLAELSTLTGLSPFHVSRTFRAAVGVPPYAYLALVRVRRAREMLSLGYPLSAVTHATGFSDQSHFTKQFKRVVGVPPGQYAREVARSTGTPRPAGDLRRGAHPRRLPRACVPAVPRMALGGRRDPDRTIDTRSQGA